MLKKKRYYTAHYAQAQEYKVSIYINVLRNGGVPVAGLKTARVNVERLSVAIRWIII